MSARCSFAIPGCVEYRLATVGLISRLTACVSFSRRSKQTLPTSLQFQANYRYLVAMTDQSCSWLSALPVSSGSSLQVHPAVQPHTTRSNHHGNNLECF